MRVLMVQTPSVESITQERVYPIGIVALATYLRQAGHEVDLLDMNLAVDQFGALKEKVLDFRPQLVGLSLRNIDPLANKTSSLIPPFVVVARMVKALRPTATVREKYRALNRILIKYFTAGLEILQSDQSFNLADMEEMVSQAKDEINIFAP